MREVNKAKTKQAALLLVNAVVLFLPACVVLYSGLSSW
jgi:hypothetical protein